MSTIPNLADTYYRISASLWLTGACIQSKPKDIQNLAGTDYLLLAATELGFIATTAFGIIETIFWSSIFLLAKAIHVFLPESEIADRIFTQIGVSTALTIEATNVAANMIVSNFFMNARQVVQASEDFAYDVYIPFVEEHLLGVINYRLFEGRDIVITRAAYNNF